MIIGDRIRQLREEKNLSQGDIETRTGLLRCYVSRVENGHTVPAIETLEKFSRALEIPLYQLVYDGPLPPKDPLSKLPKGNAAPEWGTSGKDARLLGKLAGFLGQMDERNRKILFAMAQRMASRRRA
jgi:transcriptional regulator with XRE-family HTH domain